MFPVVIPVGDLLNLDPIKTFVARLKSQTNTGGPLLTSKLDGVHGHLDFQQMPFIKSSHPTNLGIIIYILWES